MALTRSKKEKVVPPKGTSSLLCSRMSSNLEEKVPDSILKFADQLNMKVSQTKSQRKFGPSRDRDLSWEPEKGSEVFVGRIPWNSDERELVPFLEQAGSIYQIRLMLDLTNGGSGGNRCRGYCFVKYYEPEEARRAVCLLHNQFIREGHSVVVNASVENVRLVLFGMPTYISAKSVALELSKFSAALLKVELMCDPNTTIPGIPEDAIAYVTFVNHRAAAAARKKMLELKPLILWGKAIYVDWAEPEALSLQPEPTSPICYLNEDPEQDWSGPEEGSYQVVESDAAAIAMPAFAPQQLQPVYCPFAQPVHHQLIPLVPVYFTNEPFPAAATSAMWMSAQIGEMNGVEEGPMRFFPGSFHYTPPPFIQPEEMYW